MRKLNWKKIAIRAVWLLAGIGMIVLLGAAMQRKDRKACADIKVEITGANKHMFIDEKDVLDIINKNYPVKGSGIASINLRGLELLVEKNPWVHHAEMFIDNNQQLQVRIDERQPVARVFTLQGNSFYLDSASNRLPLSEKLSARVPVFTGFPSDKPSLARPDSILLSGIVKLGQFISADSFWMAQVAQVDITPQAGFEIIPVIGDHVIAFGNAEDIKAKFKRLYTFYQKAWLQNGINTYEKLDVQYNNQVVAVKRGTAKAMVDSAKAMQLMNAMIAATEMGMKDSAVASDRKIVGVTPARDSSAKSNTKPIITAPVVKPAAKTNLPVDKSNKTSVKPLSKGVKTKITNQKAKKAMASTPKGKPKAVMIKEKKQKDQKNN